MPVILFFNVFSCSCGAVFKTNVALTKHVRSRKDNGKHLKLKATHIKYDALQPESPKLTIEPGMSQVGYA